MNGDTAEVGDRDEGRKNNFFQLVFVGVYKKDGHIRLNNLN